MNLTYGLYNGDFLPYQESHPENDDFWTGYYSSRLHIKRVIRHVFNDLQSTKTLIAIRSIQGNSGSIIFNDTMAKQLDTINNHITEAERKWAILMHHDAITGTHNTQTEPSYYKILDESMENLESARKVLETTSLGLPDSSMRILRVMFKILTNPKCTHYTVVNPSGYARNQLMNFTIDLPEKGANLNYIIMMQKQDKIIPFKNESYYVDMYDLDQETKKLVKTRKLMFVHQMDALSDNQIYVYTVSNPSDCDKKFYI
jgi:hypothetical protein